MNKRKIGVLVSGRGSNLQAIMDKIFLEKLPIEVAIVISDSAEAYALERAEKAGVPHVAIVRHDFKDKASFEKAIDDKLREAGVELVVLAGFMRILSGDFVSKWPQAIINIHPALLPAFKGLDAQGQALKYGVKVAGCTVHFVDAGMDSGPIIMQRAVPVYDEDTHDTLAARILVQEHTILPEAVQLWCEGRLEVKGRRVKIRKE
ncbi:MAG: phosphoribosylglycinamide formyltransferase [Acidaminococcus sp.]|nr:phosphoribosylglycinamide formyltransferase [Acidaminococcus sp.]MCI2100942.1 phosphoribosylglycinamide formyltransferase [Acidaminococcus sp.]MCI2115285.1 phosphoribosylglycinamide formyltransferase [Acidaminococcus sp.]MCI2117360.1 phosphoribosylglycinamide formyltransferase [Acidaminococcus sp.]